jgi:hypothetical protein
LRNNKIVSFYIYYFKHQTRINQQHFFFLVYYLLAARETFPPICGGTLGFLFDKASSCYAIAVNNS